MPDLPTRADLFDVFANEVLTRASTRSTGRQITAAEIYTPGSDINLIGVGASVMGEEVMRATGRGLSDLTLYGAKGDALDRYVADKYSNRIPRKKAAAARAVLTLARPTGTFGGFVYPAGAIVATTGGLQFALMTAATFAGASVGPVTVNAKAVNAGTAGNVATGSITQKVTPSADPTMTVTNLVPATGGDATESDASYVARVEAFFPALVRGTLPALEYGARTVGGIRSASAVEELDPVSGLLTGRTLLYIADANGQANGALIAEVVTALREYRVGGLPVAVIGGTPVYLTITYHLAFLPGVNSVEAFGSVQAITVARVNQLAPGEALYRSLLFECARAVSGVVVPSDAVTAPAGDVIPASGSGQVLKTTADLVTNA